MEICKRIPRPLGVSILLNEYRKTGLPEYREKATKICIQYWLMTGGYIWGNSMSMLELCDCLHIGVEVVQNQMKESMVNTKLWDKGGDTDELVSQLIGTQIAWALEDRMEISGQVNLLRHSQGDHYTPFVTGEVNKALDLKQKASNNLGNLIKNLTGGGSINIFNNNQQANPVQDISVTIVEATELLASEMRKIDRPQEIAYIDAHYDLEGLPEVKAMQQTGIDTSKEGHTMKTSDLALITDNYKGAIEVSDNEHHEMRREIEQRINPEAIDPEIESY